MDGADAIVVALFRDQQLAQFRKTKPFDSFYWTLPSLILSLFHYFSNFLSFSLSLFLWYFFFLSLNVFLSLSFDASAYLFLLPPNLFFCSFLIVSTCVSSSKSYFWWFSYSILSPYFFRIFSYLLSLSFFCRVSYLFFLSMLSCLFNRELDNCDKLFY